MDCIIIFIIIFIIIIIIIILIDISLSIYRNYRRSNYYNISLSVGKITGKKLLVIGNPVSGVWNKHIKQAYGCGDICLDLLGCDCPIQIKGDILKELKKMNTNSFVIYESCVLEYIDQTKLPEVKKEIDRVSGGHYYGVRIFPNIVPLVGANFLQTGDI